MGFWFWVRRVRARRGLRQDSKRVLVGGGWWLQFLFMKSPDEATLAARASWTNRGTARPEFAIEPEHGQRSVWDFPRPPALQPTEHVIEVSLGGVVIAHSEAALELLETSHPPTYYVPRADVEMSYLAVAGGGGSHCEWKGKARYFDVIVGDTCLPRVAW